MRASDLTTADNNDSSKAESSSRTVSHTRRRWFQFSLRTLLILTVILGLTFAWHAYRLNKIKRQQQIVQRLQEKGCIVKYDYDVLVPRSYMRGMPDFDIDTDGITLSMEKESWIERWLYGEHANAKVKAICVTQPGFMTTEEYKLLAELSNLSFLELRDKDYDGQILKDIVKFAPALEKLHITEYELASTDFTTLSRLSKLRKVWIGQGKAFDDSAIEQFSKLSQLKSLIVKKLSVTDAGLKHLDSLKSLEVLFLDRCLITGSGFESVRLPQLITLHISNTNTNDTGVGHFVNAAPKLRDVTMRNSSVTDAAAEQLVRLNELDSLRINRTKISEKGLMKLVSLKKLQYLEIGPAAPSTELLQHFQINLPKCKFGVATD